MWLCSIICCCVSRFAVVYLRTTVKTNQVLSNKLYGQKGSAEGTGHNVNAWPFKLCNQWWLCLPVPVWIHCVLMYLSAHNCTNRGCATVWCLATVLAVEKTKQTVSASLLCMLSDQILCTCVRARVRMCVCVPSSVCFDEQASLFSCGWRSSASDHFET